MNVAESAFPHIRQFYGTLGRSVHEPIAALRMEFRRCDNLGQLFHVGRLDVDDVETLVLDVEVPQVDPEVVATDESLAIAVHGYAIDMICMGIGISLTRHRSNHRVVVREPWEF
jgi:hypothetical protein